MIRRPPRSTQSRSSAASDVYKRQRHRVLLVFGALCQHKTLAGQEHGRTIPLSDIDALPGAAGFKFSEHALVFDLNQPPPRIEDGICIHMQHNPIDARAYSISYT